MRSKQNDDEHPDEIIETLRKRATVDWGPDFLDRHGANALSFGWKVAGGRPTRLVSMRIHVQPGTKSRRRKGVDFIKKRLACGVLDSGRELVVRTDVEESARPRATGDNDPVAVRKRIPGGVSIGATGTAGTLGGWAWDHRLQAPVLVSAAHIFPGPQGSPIMQPAKLDRMLHKERIVGRIHRVNNARPGETNLVDAATAMPNDPAFVRLSVLDVGPAIMATRRPTLGVPVEKFGRASRLTRGTIMDAFWRGWVGLPTGEWVFYTDCIRIVEEDRGVWAERGDSGSLVFEQNALGDGSHVKPAIGLHFAADEVDLRIGIACRIDNVFNALDLTTFPDGLLTQLLQPLGEVRARHLKTSVLPDLISALNHGRGGEKLLALLNRHRVRLVEALIRSQPLRDAVGHGLRTLLRDTTDAASLLDAPMTPESLRTVTTVLHTLRDRTTGPIRNAAAALLQRFEGTVGRTPRDLLELEQDHVFEPVIGPAVVTTEELYGAYVEEFGDELMRRFGAIAVAVGKPPIGVDAPDGVVVKFFALPQRLATVRRRVPKELEWKRKGQPSLRLRTAVVAARPVKKR